MLRSNHSGRTWIAFIDLLGTKDSARIKKSEYPDKIRTFNRTLEEQAYYIDANVKVRYFSDSVYVECSDPVELLRFCSRVRWLLFSEEIFFKSALCEGVLDEVLTNKQEKLNERRSLDVSGASFGSAAVAVYYAQENFKGIGFSLDRSSLNPELEHYTCKSYFPIGVEKRTWHQYFDVRYSESEIGGVVKPDGSIGDAEVNVAYFDCILEAALRANAKQKNLSRYYLSSMITSINSSDFSQLEFHNGKWQFFPVSFYHIFLNYSNRKNYSSIVGFEALYLSMANIIFNSDFGGVPRYLSPAHDSICNEVVKMLIGLKILKNPIESLPSGILDHDVADNIARRAVSIRMK